MRLLKISSAILLMVGTSACKTLETPKIVDSACVSFGRLSYAIPPVVGGVRTGDDPGNRYDTVETIAGISEHNARWNAVCVR